MKANLATVKKLESSFLSCEKDFETILRKLFIESQPHGDELKRLLVINADDCMNKNNEYYNQVLNKYDLATLKKEKYVKFQPKVNLPESEEIKSYIIISMDNFTPSRNPHYRDCNLFFDILCHPDYWELKDYQVRPLKIAGYIDGIMNRCKLSGIGTLEFDSCDRLTLDNGFTGYSLGYIATHGNDDKIPVDVNA